MAELRGLLVAGVALAAATVAAVHVGADSVDAASAASVDGREGPALSIASDGDFFLPPRVFVYSSDDTSGRSDLGYNVGGGRYFDRVEVRRRDASDDKLEFAVEHQPDKSKYRWCYSSNECSHVEVGIVDDSGALFLFADEASSSIDIGPGGLGLDEWGPKPANRREDYYFVSDWPTQGVELSVEIPERDLKIYREILLQPAERAPDCADYPDRDADRYSCLFLAEQLPSPPPSTPQSMIDALPSLVQPKANYRLVFAEEFNGTPEANGCKEGLDNGMVTLSGDIWNFDTNPCNNVDSNGVPCENVEDGSFYMAVTSVCNSTLDSSGRFRYKYGYLEIGYTLEKDRHSTFAWMNLAMSIGDPHVPLKNNFARYDIPTNSYEDVSRYLGTVINLYEWVPTYGRQVSHQWINHLSWAKSPTTKPRRSNQWIQICNDGIPRTNPPPLYETQNACTPSSEATLIRGIEWTPGGYRSIAKVGGIHDSPVVVPMDKIEIVEWSDEQPTHQAIDDDEGRGRFFEFLTEDDQDSILEKIAISHIPLDLVGVAWGWPSSPRITAKLKIDYIRVFQPVDRYAGMEPVYQ